MFSHSNKQSPQQGKLLTTLAARPGVIWTGLLALVILGAYYPVIFSEYGFTDDYVAVTFNKTVEPWDLISLPTALGRPLSRLLISFANRPVDSIGDLAFLRAISVTGLILSASLCFLLLRNLRVTVLPAALTAAALSLNPSAGVFAGWAITYSYPFSVFLSLLGGWLLIRAIEQSRLAKLLGGILCILLSLMIYQPTALACLILFGVYFYRADQKQPSPKLQHWIAVLGLTAFTMVVYYVLYKAYLPLLEDSGITNARGGIVTDIPAKLEYFIKGPLWESTVWWACFAPRWFAWTLVAGMVSCLLFIARKHVLTGGWLKGASMTGLFLLTLLLAASPILVPSQNGHQFRVFFSLMSLIGAIPAIAIANWGIHSLHRITVFVSIVALGGLSHYFVRNGIVKPHSTEVAAYKRYLQETFSEAPTIAIFKHTLLGSHQLTDLKKIHEYGGYSSWLPWVPHHLINILLWEQFPERAVDHTEAEIIQVYPWQIHNYPEGIPVLDANYILKGKYSPRYRAYKRNMLKAFVSDEYEDPLLGTTETLNRFWLYSVSFGYLRLAENNVIEFLDYGPYVVRRIQSTYGDIRMTRDDGTRLITTREKFPQVYDEAQDRWRTLPISRMSLTSIRSGDPFLIPNP